MPDTADRRGDDRRGRGDELVGQSEHLVLVDRRALGAFGEARLDVGQRRRAGHQDRQRHEGGDDGEHKTEGAARPDGQRHADREGHEKRGQRPGRAIENEVHRHDEQSEQREIPQTGARRFPFQVGVDVRSADPADPVGRRGAGFKGQEGAVDSTQSFVPPARPLDLEVEEDPEEVVSHEPLLAEEVGAGCEAAELVRPAVRITGPGMDPVVERQCRERAHARDRAEAAFDRADPRECPGRERIRRLDQEDHLLPFREEALELPVVPIVRVALHDQPGDGVVALDPHRLENGQRNQQRVERDDPEAPGDDEAENDLKDRGRAPVHGRHRVQHGAPGVTLPTKGAILLAPTASARLDRPGPRT